MYDVAVIGGGPGGYAAAIRAAQLGAAVLLIESDRIGGTCVNSGCIPSKAWLCAGDLLYQIRRAKTFGIEVAFKGVNVAAIRERTDGIVGDIRMGMEGILASNRIQSTAGRAVIKHPGRIDVEGRIFDAKTIIIATGSRPYFPAVRGLEEVASPTNRVFEMKRLPESALIVGGGHLETEMATLLSRLGVKVILAADEARLLPREDRETSQRVGQALRTEGVEVLTRTRIVSAEKSSSVCTAALSGTDEKTVRVEEILVGSRRPNTAHIGLEQVGVRTGPDSGIQVDERLRTSVGGIYAVGDATGGWMLSHIASAMGIAAAENAMGKSSVFRPGRIPRGYWTSPEVAAVGLTQEEAEAQGYDIEVGDFPFSINGLALASDRITGAVKIISESRFGKILGVHVVGSRATEIIGEAVLAIELECTIQEYAKSLRVHPTFSETLVEAARDAANWALYLPPGR